jgi:hypothetical protein
MKIATNAINSPNWRSARGLECDDGRMAYGVLDPQVVITRLRSPARTDHNIICRQPSVASVYIFVMEFLSAALSALPTVATSAYALAAYAILIAAWGITGWRVNRNNNLLFHLEKIPRNQRLAALESEMRGVRLAGGLSPEQWLRYRRNKDILTAFLATLLALAAIFALSMFQASRGVAANADLYDEPAAQFSERFSEMGTASSGRETSETARGMASTVKEANAGGEIVAPENTFNLMSEDSGTRRTQTQRSPLRYVPQSDAIPLADASLRYNYIKVDGRIIIRPQVPYFESKDRQEIPRISDISANNFPKLSFKVVNNTRNTIVLSEVVFTIKSTKRDLRPLLRVESQDDRISFINEGWGPVVNPVLTVEFSKSRKCDKKDSSQIPELSLTSFTEQLDVKLDKHIPAELRPTCNAKSGICNRKEMCIQGQLVYRDQDEQRRFIIFQETKGGGEFTLASAESAVVPSYSYDVIFPSSGISKTIRKSISQKVKPGDSDQFLVQVRSDRSANFEFTAELVDIEGKTVSRHEIDLALFKFRTARAQ